MADATHRKNQALSLDLYFNFFGWPLSFCCDKKVWAVRDSGLRSLQKKWSFFFALDLWLGVDTTNSYICQQKINFKSSPNSGWLAGWLKKVASWLRHHRWYPVSRHWVDAKFCARAIRLDRNFVPFWRHLQSWCLDRRWWGETTTTLQGELPVSSNMGNPHENSFLLVKSSTNVFFFLVPYLMTGYWHWNRKGEEGSSR